MANADAVARAVAALSAAYRREFDKASIVTWGRALKDLDDVLLDRAVEQWIRNSTQFPVPAQILQTARILADRKAPVAALPVSESERERQRQANRRGMAMVRQKLKQGRLRVGQNLDEFLDDDKENETDGR